VNIKVKHLDPLITKDDISVAEAEVGFFGDKKEPKANRAKGFKSFAGGQALKSPGKSGVSITDVATYNDDRYDWFNFVTNNTDESLAKVTVAMAMLICKYDDKSIRRYKNALTEWLRRPIKSRNFGSNAPRTIKWKGFDWPMVRTGTMFRAVKARLKMEE
jgi:hypothetical protein